MIEEEQPSKVSGVFVSLNKNGLDAGRPGVDEMVYNPQTSGRASARACNPHVVNDQLTVPTSGGSVDTYVAKTTNTVAFGPIWSHIELHSTQQFSIVLGPNNLPYHDHILR